VIKIILGDRPLAEGSRHNVMEIHRFCFYQRKIKPKMPETGPLHSDMLFWACFGPELHHLSGTPPSASIFLIRDQWVDELSMPNTQMA